MFLSFLNYIQDGSRLSCPLPVVFLPVIFGDIEFTFYEIILFGIAMIFYLVGCMGVLMLKIFGLFNKLDDYILNKK